MLSECNTVHLCGWSCGGQCEPAGRFQSSISISKLQPEDLLEGASPQEQIPLPVSLHALLPDQAPG